MNLREAAIDAYYAAIGMRPRPIFRQLLRNLERSREELLAEQHRRLSEILQLCIARVPFYRVRVSEARIELFPVLRKEMIDEHFDELIAEAALTGRERVATGSGTTRIAMRALLDRQSLAWARAAGWRNQVLRKVPLHSRAVHLQRDPYKISRLERIKRRIGQYIINYIILDSYLQDESAVRRLHREIARLRPVQLGGFTSSILTFVRISKQLGLPAPRVAVISAYGENVFEEHRRELSEYFGVRVVSGYGAREIGLAAVTCEQWNYHILTELVYLEVLDEDGEVRPYGSGRLLVTTLRNEVMPLVRYDIGDLATISPEPCPCGLPFPVITELSGRTTEMLRRPDGVIISSNALSRIFVYLNALDWRVTQDSADHLRIEVVPTAQWGPADEEKWRGDLGRLTEGTMRVDFALVQAIAPRPNGKRPNVVCELSSRY